MANPTLRRSIAVNRTNYNSSSTTNMFIMTYEPGVNFGSLGRVHSGIPGMIVRLTVVCLGGTEGPFCMLGSRAACVEGRLHAGFDRVWEEVGAGLTRTRREYLNNFVDKKYLVRRIYTCMLLYIRTYAGFTFSSFGYAMCFIHQYVVVAMCALLFSMVTAVYTQHRGRTAFRPHHTASRWSQVWYG